MKPGLRVRYRHKEAVFVVKTNTVSGGVTIEPEGGGKTWRCTPYYLEPVGENEDA